MMAKLFENVFNNDSQGMSEWPETVRTVEQQIAEHQAKFDQVGEQNGGTPSPSTDTEQS